MRVSDGQLHTIEQTTKRSRDRMAREFRGQQVPEDVIEHALRSKSDLLALVAEVKALRVTIAEIQSALGSPDYCEVALALVQDAVRALDEELS